MASEWAKLQRAIQLGPGVFVTAGKTYEPPKPRWKRKLGKRELARKYAASRLRARRARQLRLKLDSVRRARG